MSMSTSVEERLIRMETHLEYIAKHIGEQAERFARYDDNMQRLEEKITRLEIQQNRWQAGLIAITGVYTVIMGLLNYAK